MRGKDDGSAVVTYDKRITPAYAGKSITEETMSKVIQGSPPRMRGKVILHGYIVFDVGITPAYAGKRTEH